MFSLLHLESGPVPLYLYYIPALFILITLSQALSPSTWRVPLTLPFLVLLVSQFCLHKWQNTSIQTIGGVAVWVFNFIFVYADRVYFANPDKENWHRIPGRQNEKNAEDVVKGDDRELHAETTVPVGFKNRLHWSLTSMLAQRGVGWSWQISSLPPASSQSRLAFLTTNTIQVLLWHIPMSGLVHYTINTSFGSVVGDADNKPITPFASASLPQQLVLSVVLIGMQYIGLAALGSCINIGSVALRLARPEECRPLVGVLGAAYTVRNAWSITWHQLLRRTFTWTGRLIAHDTLSLPRDSATARTIRVTTAFFVSALLHALGSHAVRHQGAQANMAFFMLQPVAFFVEEQVLKLGRQAGLRDGILVRAVGYLWTVSWFAYTSRIMWADAAEAGPLVFPWRPYDLLGVGYWIRSGQTG